MFKKLAPVATLALLALPGLALAQSTSTAPATPDFCTLTDYITACFRVGGVAFGIAIVAGLAFSILVRIGKKITGAA